MNKADINFKKLPEAPGVYLFRGARGKILYIGKATSLRSRVRSYFGKNLGDARGPLLVQMLTEAKQLTVEQTDSVLEALILEANLIKKHQPAYNTRDKDNKSFNYVVVTKEAFPRVLIVRGRDLFTTWRESDIKSLFGPYAEGTSLKAALAIVRKIFPFRDTCEPHSGAPCFNAQIGLCPGVCTDAITQTEYANSVKHIQLFFSGKKKQLLTALEKNMKQLAKGEQFEEAARVRSQLFALTHIQETALLGSEYKVSKGSSTERIEAFDIAHISETSRVGVMVVLEGGKPKKSEYKKFIIRTDKKGDIAALEEVLERRFAHAEWQLPSMLVIDGGTAQKNATQRVLADFGYALPIINTVKDEKHRVARIVGNKALVAQHEKSILLANNEAHRFAIAFHDSRRRKQLFA